MTEATRPTIRQFEGEGFNIATIIYKGVPYVLAKEVGRALGYAEEGSKLTYQVTQIWDKEFIEGQDYVRIKGRDLKDLKKVMTHHVSTYANQIVLLSRSGVDLVSIKTEKEVGRRLRRWLIDVVFPALRSGESIHATTDKAKDERQSLAMMRERRLTSREQRLVRRERRLQRESDRRYEMAMWRREIARQYYRLKLAEKSREALLHLIDSHREKLGDEVVFRLNLKAARAVVGEQLCLDLVIKTENDKSPDKKEFNKAAHTRIGNVYFLKPWAGGQ